MTNAGYVKRFKPSQGPLAPRDDEARHPDSMEREQLLRERLVLAEHERVRPGARVGHLHELEQRGDVRLVRAVGEEGLAQVEDDVRLERRHAVEDDLRVVVDGERLDVVLELAKAREHVGLGRLGLLGAQRLHGERPPLGHGPVHVEEDEDAHVA